MIPKNRIPTHPGEILFEEFLSPANMTQIELASKMGVPIQRVNTIIKGKRDISPETAILLSRVLNTTPEFWMNLQTVRDLALARKHLDQSEAKVGKYKLSSSDKSLSLSEKKTKYKKNE